MTQRFDTPERQQLNAAFADVESAADNLLSSFRRFPGNQAPTQRFKPITGSLRKACMRPSAANDGVLSPCTNCLVQDVCDAVTRRARLVMHSCNHGLFAGARVRYSDSLIDRLSADGVASDRLKAIGGARGILTGNATTHEGQEYVEVRWNGKAEPLHWACVEWLHAIEGRAA